MQERQRVLERPATHIRERIGQRLAAEAQTMSATFDGDQLDASLIQLLDLRFFAPDDPRFLRYDCGGRSRAAARLAHAALRHRG